MNQLVISIIIIVIIVVAWLLSLILKAGKKFKLSKERPVSHRLEKAIKYLQKEERITNSEYKKLVRVSDSTATKDLDELEKLGLIEQVGKSGRGVYYVLKK